METRVIVAFVLSIAVFVIWSYFFTPQKATPPAEQAPTTTLYQALADKPEAAAKRASVESKSAAKPATPPSKVNNEIAVKTNLYTATFTEYGGRLISFTLNKYKEKAGENSPPQNLVSVEAQEDMPLGVFFLNNSVPGLRSVHFDADKSGLRLERPGSENVLSFTYTNGEGTNGEGITVIKTYRFNSDSYLFDLNVTVKNNSKYILDDSLVIESASLPFAKKTRRRYSFAGLGLLANGELFEIKPGKLEKKLADLKQSKYSLTWAAYEDQYFLASILPGNPDQTKIRAWEMEGLGIRFHLIDAPIRLNPGSEHSVDYQLYYGPKDYNTLKSLNNTLDRAIYLGWFDLISKPLMLAMLWINKSVKNYGWTIIILTILIKIVFWPLTAKSYKSMKAMQQLQPKMAKLREKYTNDRETLNREMMQLYKTHKVNPLGGCLPMIIQLPIFIGFYRLLDYSIALRHASFGLWIHDLSAPERLFNFSFKIPYMQEPSGIPVLTILMGASWILQQKMSPTTGDPTQAKIMMLMPVFFTFIFINFPAGLVLYWFVNNLLSIGQQFYTNKLTS